MKICSFKVDGRLTYGTVRNDEQVVDLKVLLGDQAPGSLEELIVEISSGAISLEALEHQCENAPAIALNEVFLQPPVPRPGKVLGVALNNRIAQQIAFRPFAAPAFFIKPTSCLTAHGQPVVVREDYGLTHPEPELAIVIGRGGKAIPESEALQHVFGYTIINDVTSPGLKERDSIELVVPSEVSGGYRDLMDWRKVKDEEDSRSIYLTYHALSKGADTFGPIGPWIVTADKVENPNRLAINSFDGDDLVFEDSTANLTFTIEQIISHASNYMTLEPGDIIHCGTAMRPAENGKFRLLTQWDLVQTRRPMAIEIQGIGRLVNPVVLA